MGAALRIAAPCAEQLPHHQGRPGAALGDRPGGQPGGTGTGLGDSPAAQDRWIRRAGEHGWAGRASGRPREDESELWL